MADSGARATPSRGLAGPARVLALLGTVSLLSAPLLVHADAAQDAPRLVPPPPPAEHDPLVFVEVRSGVQAPLERSTLCPDGTGCVLGAGVGLGAVLERRGSDRIGLLAAYEFWLLDGGGVYELATMHAIRGGVRYVIDDACIVHPLVDATIGMLAFGDTANVATLGGVVTVGGGAEVELSESVAVVARAELWLLSTGPFRTHDDVMRAGGFGVTVVAQASIGVSLQLGPSTRPP